MRTSLAIAERNTTSSFTAYSQETFYAQWRNERDYLKRAIPELGTNADQRHYEHCQFLNVTRSHLRVRNCLLYVGVIVQARIWTTAYFTTSIALPNIVMRKMRIFSLFSKSSDALSSEF